MSLQLKSALLLGLAMMTPAALYAEPVSKTQAQAQAQAQLMESVRPLIKQQSMNVFRRFDPAVTNEMVKFYDEVLALKALSPIKLGGGQTVMLFGIGGSQIKLAAGQQNDREYHLGAVNAGTGIRLFTLFFPDEEALIARFVENGFTAPSFMDNGGGTRAAIALDPGGFTLELVILPGAAPEEYGKVEVGINVSNLDTSQKFYREFVGLDELPVVHDALLGVTKHPFRHGATTINLWSEGADLARDTGSAGIQYVVSDATTIDARGKARNITVETPLGGLPGFDLLFVWLNDPDGVTNYFAQIGGRPSAAE